jgi:hypothetical protein
MIQKACCETNEPVIRRLVLLRPSAQLNCEGHSQLRELQHVREAELRRDVIATAHPTMSIKSDRKNGNGLTRSPNGYACLNSRKRSLWIF